VFEKERAPQISPFSLFYFQMETESGVPALATSARPKFAPSRWLSSSWSCFSSAGHRTTSCVSGELSAIYSVPLFVCSHLRNNSQFSSCCLPRYILSLCLPCPFAPVSFRAEVVFSTIKLLWDNFNLLNVDFQ